MTDFYIVLNEEILCVDKFIGDNRCAELCHRLSQNESSGSCDSVRRLILRGNCLSIRSAQSLGEVLRGNHSLDLLSMEWNQLGSSGASFISHALEHNTHLQQVDLRNNGIGDDGAMAFGQSLLSNDTLRVLDLRWNQIGDDGAMSFEKALKQRKTQLSILLTGNLVSHKVMDLLEKWSQAYKNNAPCPAEEESPPAPPPLQLEAGPSCGARCKEVAREHSRLQQQVGLLTAQNADMRRQLDTSAITVTDLEQKLLREEFLRIQADERLGAALAQVSELTGQLAVAASMWEAQRAEMVEDHRRALADMATEIKGHVGEKDSLKDRLRKTKESLENLEVHSERLQRQAKEEIDELQEELRLMTARASASALTEARATTAAHVAQAGLTRVNERMAALEAELVAASEQAERRAEAEQRAHQEEIDQQRRRAAEQLQEAADKINALAEDCALLRARLAEATSRVSSLEIQMQQRCEEAASAAQSLERQRSEAIAENLKLRIEAVSQEKRDAESKLAALMEELKAVRQGHNTELRGLQETLAERRAECTALRQEALAMHTRELDLVAEVKRAAAELDSLRTRVADIDGREARLQEELRRVGKERDALLGAVQTHEREARRAAARTQEDFLQLSQRMTELVARELDAARPKFTDDGKSDVS